VSALISLYRLGFIIHEYNDIPLLFEAAHRRKRTAGTSSSADLPPQKTQIQLVEGRTKKPSIWFVLKSRYGYPEATPED